MKIIKYGILMLVLLFMCGCTQQEINTTKHYKTAFIILYTDDYPVTDQMKSIINKIATKYQQDWSKLTDGKYDFQVDIIYQPFQYNENWEIINSKIISDNYLNQGAQYDFLIVLQTFFNNDGWEDELPILWDNPNKLCGGRNEPMNDYFDETKNFFPRTISIYCFNAYINRFNNNFIDAWDNRWTEEFIVNFITRAAIHETAHRWCEDNDKGECPCIMLSPYPLDCISSIQTYEFCDPCKTNLLAENQKV